MDQVFFILKLFNFKEQVIKVNRFRQILRGS